MTLARGERERLPARRPHAETVKAQIGERTIYLHTGDYVDGRLGEIFVTLSKRGSVENAYMDAFAIAVSLGLQHGVPLEAFVHRFIGTRSEPFGVVQDHDRIRMASSPHDFVMRELAIRYLGRDDLAHVEEPRT